GMALLRAFAGEYSHEFTEARLAEVRALLDAADRLGPGGPASPMGTGDLYRSWATYYDRPGNQMIDLEQPVVWQILDGLPAGIALDAACGTGRHAAHLAGLGHTVIGVDGSAEMLAIGRGKVPAARLHRAELRSLPILDDRVDL